MTAPRVTIVPFDEGDEGQNEMINPATGADVSDIQPNSVESMPVQDGHYGQATFEGDMGRMTR